MCRYETVPAIRASRATHPVVVRLIYRFRGTDATRWNPVVDIVLGPGTEQPPAGPVTDEFLAA